MTNPEHPIDFETVFRETSGGASSVLEGRLAEALEKTQWKTMDLVNFQNNLERKYPDWELTQYLGHFQSAASQETSQRISGLSRRYLNVLTWK